VRKDILAVVEDPGMAVLALVGGTVAAIATGIVAFVLAGFVVALPIVWFLEKVHLANNEAGPWSLMVIDFPVAFICGASSFVYCFRKLLNYGNSPG
jgi:hypothetical protein